MKLPPRSKKYKADSQANDYSASFMKALMVADEGEKNITQE